MRPNAFKEAIEFSTVPIPDTARSLLDKYERAARCGGEGLWEWNLSSGALWCSPGLKQLLAYPESEWDSANVLTTFNHLLEQVHPSHRNPVLHNVRRHLEQQHVLDLECQIETRGGELRWFNLRGAAQRDQSGHPQRLSGSIRDITDNKRNAEHARHAEAFQRRTLDALHVGVGVLNSRGEIVEINRFWREFPIDNGLIGARFGFGENYLESCDKAAPRCPEGPMAAAGIREVLAGKRQAFALTYSTAVPGGMRYYELRAQAFAENRGGEDVTCGAFIMHMDVSATREAYAALQGSRDFYERILNAIPIQISYVDKHQRILYMNQSYEHWLQLPLAAMEGRKIAEVTTPVRYLETAQRIERVMEGQTVEFEQRESRADGALRELAVTYVPHRDPCDEVAGFVSVVRDVTDQKRLEASLHQSQKMEALGQLTGGIAHDFNNLLSAIIGNLQLLERPLRGHKRLLKHVQTPLHAALRGAELTRRLLAFARQSSLEPQVVNANALLIDMRELLGRSLGREIDIRCSFAEDAWPVRVDPGQLENCILNLGINARDAMRRGGTLSISTHNVTIDAELASRHPKLRPADYLLVTVTDTGGGMTAEVVKRAFEPFFTTKEVGKGTGLGLSMVYGFLEHSGGVATLYSELGVGTTVRLYFPRAADSATPAAAPARIESDITAAAPRGTETVLVVEDDVDVRATAVRALVSFGYTVIEASDAVGALRILEEQGEIDLLFSDITLPGGILGPAVATRAKELRPGLKVLFTSGFTETTAVHRGMIDGPLKLIPKPYAITDLARRVRTVLDQE